MPSRPPSDSPLAVFDARGRLSQAGQSEPPVGPGSTSARGERAPVLQARSREGSDREVAPPAANCRLGGGCGSASPTGAGEELSRALPEKARNHPCYGADAHHHFARMHVAVAPACNIQCNYCNRKYDCASENRPGVVSERLTPPQALRKVLAVAAAVPALSVVGIAGPGDPLANPERTFATLELLRRALPDLSLCVSTNGLALPEAVDRLVAAGVAHVTVTVNMLEAEVGERIYPWIVRGGKLIRGREASRILSERQLEGIERLAARGVLVKVNSVLIPGVNDAHIPAVSRKVHELGAFLHNVMPLVSAPEHGTHYGLTGQRGPTPAELEAVREACGGGAAVMRHCRQCRADAVGMLGEDRNAEFELARLPTLPAAADAGDARLAHRAAVERRRTLIAEARDEALSAADAAVPAGVSARVAVATRGDGLVNQHFGHASEFQVYDVSRAGARLVGVRKVEHYCRGGDGEDGVLEATLEAISDCAAVLVAKVGRCPRERLAEAGIEPVDRHAFQPIEAAALAWLAERAERDREAAREPGPRPALGQQVA
jgi:nitrogen fixation protein NifB